MRGPSCGERIGELFVSTYPKRAIAYWIWALGTMIALPTFLPILLKDLGRKVLRLMVAYVSSEWRYQLGISSLASRRPSAFHRAGQPALSASLLLSGTELYCRFLLFVYMVFARHRVA